MKRLALLIFLILNTLSCFTQDLKLVSIDTLEKGWIEKIYTSNDKAIENSKMRKTLFDEKGRKLRSKKYEYKTGTYIGNEYFLIDERITYRGKSLGLKKEKEKMFRFHSTMKYSKDSLTITKDIYKTDNLNWYSLKNNKLDETLISQDYFQDSIVIEKHFINGNLEYLSYYNIYAFDDIKYVEFDSLGRVSLIETNELTSNLKYIKSITSICCDYSKNEIIISKEKWRFNKWKIKTKTIPLK